MKIQVTQDDIDRGVRGNVCFCPVALAVKRATSETVYVSGMRIRIIKKANGKALEAPTPSEVSCFIAAFDHYATVEPFEFDLELQPLKKFM